MAHGIGMSSKWVKFEFAPNYPFKPVDYTLGFSARLLINTDVSGNALIPLFKM